MRERIADQAVVEESMRHHDCPRRHPAAPPNRATVMERPGPAMAPRQPARVGSGVIRAPSNFRGSPGVLALWRAGGAHPTVTDDAQALEALIARDPGGLLIAEQRGEIVGSLIAGWNGWRGSLYRLVVHPEARRRGVATELVRRAVHELQSRGARRIDAFVVTADAHAIHFWDGLVDLGLRRDTPKTRHVVD